MKHQSHATLTALLFLSLLLVTESPPLSPRQVHFHPPATNRNTSTALSHKSQQRYRRRPAKKTPDKTIPPGMADTHPIRKHQ